MKKLVDVFIVLIVLALIGGGAYFGYTEFLADTDDDDADGGETASALLSDTGVELSRLSTDEVYAVLPAQSDLPEALSAATGGEPLVIDLNTDQRAISLSEDPAARDRFVQIRNAYGWTSATSVTYNTCTLIGQNTAFVRALVSQMPTTQQGRALVNDARLQGYYKVLGYRLTPSETLHGWAITSREPVAGNCYAQEYQTLMVFDHLGLVVVLQTNTSADAEPALGRATLEALAARIFANIEGLDALQTVSIPPTPIPEDRAGALLTAQVRRETLGQLIGSTGDWDLNVFYNTNDDESMSLTLEELVAYYQEIGSATLAAAVDQAGRRYGLIAEEVRVWGPEVVCPQDAPARIEMDLLLFERPAGADAYLRDLSLQNAWRGTGLYSEFSLSEDGVYAFGSISNACGAMQIIQKSVTFERLLLHLSVVIPASVPREDATAQVDVMMDATLKELYMRRLR